MEGEGRRSRSWGGKREVRGEGERKRGKGGRENEKKKLR